MANPKKRLSTNVEGDFFVDDTCINCDTCRIVAPDNFEDIGEYSSVTNQPKSDKETANSLRALLACPTGSIGYEGAKKVKDHMEDFPYQITDNIYFNGYTSRDSFGARSYFIKDPRGNWITDAPRYSPALVKKFKDLGGIKYIFLTHRDDVADAEKYAAEFNATRIIHKKEILSQPETENVIEGQDDIEFLEDFLIIPTPGHTEGHCVLLYKNKYLFSGDHLWLSRKTGKLDASTEFCWYDFEVQKESISKLLKYQFQWVLPAHGRMVNYSIEEMKKEIELLIERIK